MKNKIFRSLTQWYALLRRHLFLTSFLLLFGALLFGSASRHIRWQPDVLQFFASDSPTAAAVRTAQSAAIGQELRVDVHLDGPPDWPVLKDAVARISQRLQASGEFKLVWSAVDLEKMIAANGAINNRSMELLDRQDLQVLAQRITSDYLPQKLQSVKQKLLDPDGEVQLKQFARDPLGVEDLVRQKLTAIGRLGTATLRDGFLVSPDGNHVMLILQPNEGPANTVAGERALAAINAAVAAETPSKIGVWIVGAHRGYAENAHQIKHDVAMICLIGTIAVGLLIRWYFKSWCAMAICLLPPVVGVGIAMGIAGMFRLELPLLLVGFGGLLCGSTTDYGIQLLDAARRNIKSNALTSSPGTLAATAAREMFGPISMSVVTSVTGFAALGLSASSGLRALGLFVAAATLCIWAVTFLVLPAYLEWAAAKLAPQSVSPIKTSSGYWKTAIFLGITLWLGIHAWRVGLNRAVGGLDGASASFHADEENMMRTWGELRHWSIVLIADKNPNAALEKLSAVTSMLENQQHDGLVSDIVSAAAVLPSDDVVAKRRQAWTNFWTPQRKSQISNALQAAAKGQGIKADMWDSYLASLGNLPENQPSAARLEQSIAALFPGMVEISDRGATLGVTVKMKEGLSPRMAVSWAGELKQRCPWVTVVGGDVLLFDATDRAEAEAERLGPIVLLAIMIPVWLYFRRITMAVIALLSLFAGIIWCFGAAELLGGGLNLVSLVPVLFTLGVAVDYGIYAAALERSAADDSGRRSGRRATFICALSTMVGSGAMVLAGHPMLRWLGVTLIAGVLGGYLASRWVVVPFMQMQTAAHKARNYKWLRRSFKLAVGLVWSALLVLLGAVVYVDWSMTREKPAGAAFVTGPAVAQVGSENFKCGDNWMRRHDGIWEMGVAGSPEDIGWATAALGAPIDYRIENEMLDMLDRLVPRLGTKWVITRGVSVNLLGLPKYVPLDLQRELWAESLSHVDGHGYLSPTYPRLLDYHALHDVSQMLIDNPLIEPQTFGCTGVVATPAYAGNGKLWLARNFDFEGGESFGRQKCVTFVRPTGGNAFATVSWPGLSGCVTGMNDKKIGLFINAAGTKDFRRIGEPTIMVAREVLERAGSLAEAEEIFREAKVFVSDIVVVGDGKTGEAIIIEKSPGGMAVRAVEGSAVVANHMMSKLFADDPVNKQRREEGTTQQRYERARNLLNRLRGKVDEHSLAGILRDKCAVSGKFLGWGNRNAIDGMIATHGVIMDLTGGKMWVAAWPFVEGKFVEVGWDEELEAGSKEQGGESDVDMDAMMRDGGWEKYLECREACRMAEKLLMQGDGAGAVAAADKAIRADGDFYLGYELRGRAEFSQGDVRTARDDLSSALERDPPYEKHRLALQRLVLRCEGL